MVLKNDFDKILYRRRIAPTTWHPPKALPPNNSVSVASGPPQWQITGTPGQAGGGDSGGGWASGGGGGGGGGGISAAQARMNQEARDRTQRENNQTRASADAKFEQIYGFEKARNAKIADIQEGLKSSDANLLANYKTALSGLMGTLRDNDAAEADSTYGNILNTLRERGEALAQVASLGAGETDRMQAQLGALRNYDVNQNEINRSFFDSLRSSNRGISSLNNETATSRNNIYNQAESDKDTAWTNFYNQAADNWAEIFNIENANTNIESDSSVGYNRFYTDAANQMKHWTGQKYDKKDFGTTLRDWAGRGSEQKRELSNNKAQVINLGGPMKTPEGATLRKW